MQQHTRQAKALRDIHENPAGHIQSKSQSPLQQIADNSASVSQLRHYNELANNSSRARQLKTLQESCNLKGHKNPVQRIIRAKSGERYDNPALLPPVAKGSATIRTRAADAGTWLVNKPGDLDKKANGDVVPMLSPHRHLIGEVHTASQFETAEKNWGWGAQKSIEGLQTSATVRSAVSDSNTTYNPTFGRNYMLGARELENFHAYYLQSLSMYIAYLKLTEDASADLEADVTDAILNSRDISPALKTRLSTRLTNCTDESKQVLLHMADYKSACERLTITVASTPAEVQLNNLKVRMNGNWDALVTRIKAVQASPMNKLISENLEKDAFKTKLMLFRTKIHALVPDIQALGDNIKDVVVDELGTPADRLVATQSWANATAPGSHNTLAPLHGMGPIRELFMQQNINALTEPAIVQIGQQHVTNLAGQINNGKYHNSYDDFVTDTNT